MFTKKKPAAHAQKKAAAPNPADALIDALLGAPVEVPADLPVDAAAPASAPEPEPEPRPDPKPEPEPAPAPAPAATSTAPTSPARVSSAARKTGSFLAGDLTFVGTLTSEGDVHLGGAFEGEVRAPIVTVGGSGRVDGAITGRRVEVLGRVKGGLVADEVRVRINAQVDGDVTTDSFTLEAGARFEGRSRRKSG